MEEVASLRPVSLIYLSVLHARFHLQLLSDPIPSSTVLLSDQIQSTRQINH